MIETDANTVDDPLPTVTEASSGDLTVSSVVLTLARLEGVDLETLLRPYSQRQYDVEAANERPTRLLDWHGTGSAGFCDPSAARRFFEAYELFPGLVVRGWGHPTGRLGFGLNGMDVNFELHVPDAGLLISGTPNAVTIALRDLLPETVCAALVGKPLERLVAWPPASGPDYVVASVEAGDGIQVVRLATTPVPFRSADDVPSPGRP